ncbi:hypothetical protein AN958_02661 [Leucoagaricus sp. SymC.cos]|nr:hypothetical protein AN958_02661 [Leucoagaricus sp. SymC.cos]
MTSKSTCPHCHKELSDAFLPTPPLESSRDEIALVQAEIRRIDDLMLRLRNERAAWLRRLLPVH